MAQQSFAAAVGEWATQTKARSTAVFRDAAQTVANEVRRPKSEGGNMPVDLGNLRRSLLASTTVLPALKGSEQSVFPNNDSQIELTIAGADIGDTIFLGFQAVYARRLEYGFVGEDSLGRTFAQSGNGFVRLTAQRWPAIVAASAEKLKARVEARQAQ